MGYRSIQVSPCKSSGRSSSFYYEDRSEIWVRLPPPMNPVGELSDICTGHFGRPPTNSSSSVSARDLIPVTGIVNLLGFLGKIVQNY